MASSQHPDSPVFRRLFQPALNAFSVSETRYLCHRIPDEDYLALGVLRCLRGNGVSNGVREPIPNLTGARVHRNLAREASGNEFRIETGSRSRTGPVRRVKRVWSPSAPSLVKLIGVYPRSGWNHRGRWTPMISSIVGRFIFTIQPCHSSATSCSAAATALSTAPTASATVLAPARFAFAPGTLRAGRSLSGDSEIGRDGFKIECFANEMPQRDDKVMCRHMATLHELLRREARQTHLFHCPQKNDVRERRFNRVAHAPAPVRTGHDFDSRSTGRLTSFTEVSRVHREIAGERAAKRFPNHWNSFDESLTGDRWVRLVGRFSLVPLLRRSAARRRVAARPDWSLSSEGELPRGHPAEKTVRPFATSA